MFLVPPAHTDVFIAIKGQMDSEKNVIAISLTNLF